jgi:DNA topoisomerase VI subunit A
LNFASPLVKTLDNAKTRIATDGFRDKLIRHTEKLCKEVIKQIKQGKIKKAKPASGDDIRTHRELMRLHFMEGYKKASGNGQYGATVRQIYYCVRDRINQEHGVQLDSKSDYESFTQVIVTEFLNQYEWLEEKVFFERRGYFQSPFLGEEVPLGTENVIYYINKQYSKKIQRKVSDVVSIPVELQFNHVLFVEKTGFNTILRDSGTLSKLNLGIMSTQGFGNRAVVKLGQFLQQKKIKVYALTDCDIAGYQIVQALRGRTSTHKSGIQCDRIGLTVNDVYSLKKENQAEEDLSYGKDYSDKVLNSLKLSPRERKFLIPDEGKNGKNRKYQRVELNALTSPELIKFIESKIKYNPIKPTVQDVEEFITINEREIIKEALYKLFGDRISIDVTKEKLAQTVVNSLDGNDVHWVDQFRAEMKYFTEDAAPNQITKAFKDRTGFLASTRILREVFRQLFDATSSDVDQTNSAQNDEVKRALEQLFRPIEIEVVE